MSSAPAASSGATIADFARRKLGGGRARVLLGREVLVVRTVLDQDEALDFYTQSSASRFAPTHAWTTSAGLPSAHPASRTTS
jgi:hypothetical protein